jgi:hypothetical protein
MHSAWRFQETSFAGHFFIFRKCGDTVLSERKKWFYGHGEFCHFAHSKKIKLYSEFSSPSELHLCNNYSLWYLSYQSLKNVELQFLPNMFVYLVCIIAMIFNLGTFMGSGSYVILWKNHRQKQS